MVRDSRGVTLQLVAGVAAVVTVLSYAGLHLWVSRGNANPAVSWVGAVLLLAMAVLIYALGLPVRRYRLGEPNANGRRPMTALRAMRVLVLAQAAALTGAAASGWYLAQILVLVPNLDIPSVRGQAIELAVLLIGAIAVVVAGLLVQRMCRIDDDDAPPNASPELR